MTHSDDSPQSAPESEDDEIAAYAREKAEFVALLEAVRHHGETWHLVAPKNEAALPVAKIDAAIAVAAQLLAALFDQPACDRDWAIEAANWWLAKEELRLIRDASDADEDDG